MRKGKQDAYSKFVSMTNIVDTNAFGYNIKALLATDILYYAYGLNFYDTLSFKKTLTGFFKALNYDILFPEVVNHNVILTILHNRIDHKSFMVHVQQQVPSSVIFNNFHIHIITSFKWKNIFFAFKHIFKQHKLTLKEKFLFASKLAVILNTLSLLEDIFKGEDLSLKKFVAFNAPYGQDALLTEFFHKKGSKTYSIQHGIYCNYKNYVPYDVINYKFVNTDYVLCWGSESKTILEGYGINSSNILVAGNPKYLNVEIKPYKTSFSKCLVLLGRFIYHDGNIELILLLKKIKELHDVDFYIKPHPSLVHSEAINFDIYREHIRACNLNLIEDDETMISLFDSGRFDFTISYNTGSYVESYLHGLISLRYSFKENEVYKGLDDSFDNESSFQNKIEFFKKTERSNIEKEIKVMVNNMLGNEINNYASILATSK